MDARAIFGFFLGIAAVALLAFVVRNCIPEPGDDIDWVRSPDAVIVQMRSFGGDSMVWSVDLDRTPSFTLYGDGTLIVSEATKNCGTVNNPCSVRLIQSHLPEGDILELLSFIDGTGFLNFRYQQPVPPVSGSATVYIYVNTKLTANAVRATALGWEPESGTEWSEFRKLKTIDKRLQALRQNAIETGIPFAPTEGELHIVRHIVTDLVGVPAWRFPQFDISAAAPGSDTGRLRLSAAELVDLELADPSAAECWCQVHQSGGLFSVYYRPILPYEEHFPEFEGPSQ